MSELKGIENALKILNDVTPKVYAATVRKGMKASGKVMEAALKAGVMGAGLYSTGNLYNSIKAQGVRTQTMRGQMTVKIVANFYGRFLEFGFLHTGKNGKHVPARPWLIPAMQGAEDAAIAEIEKVIIEEVDKLGK